VIKAATEWEASRIIIGAHGHSACPRNLTGSVSRAVGERAACAVEVVRPAVARA
jgi:nucleotide-binding universal stress UspA family protein